MLWNRIALVAPVAALALLAGCDKATINPNDASKPKAEILVKQSNGQFAVASTATLTSGGQVKIMCRITDNDGVKSAQLSFQGGTSSNCTVGSAVFSGSFPLSPPLPAPQQQTLSGDANNKVLKVLPLMADINDESCTVFGQQQKGRPLGHTITATCEGKNWSSNAQNQGDSTQLQIKVQ